MIIPGTADLVLYRNRTLRVAIALSDANGPLDCTGFSNARAQIRDYPGESGVPLASINDTAPNTNGGVITWVNKATGNLELLFAVGDSANFPKSVSGGKSYYWDLAMTEPGGDINSYLQGAVPFHEVVTQ